MNTSRAWLRRIAWSVLVAPLLALRAVAGEGLVLDDAERFAAMLRRHPGALEAGVIQAEYLRPGSDGIVIFTPNRLRDADHLAAAIRSDRMQYERAVEACLPVVRQMQAEATTSMQRVAELLGGTDAAPAYIVFGARNAGGTASARGLVLGLEVLCRANAAPEEVRALIRDFIAHEMVHVHQFRAGVEEDPVVLLRAALLEGLADYVMERVLDDHAIAGAARDAYGRAHEATLWHDFLADMRAGRRLEDTDWFYRPAVRRGQPADMGYWIGKRICAAYVARHRLDEKAALRALLEMKDEQAILADSGYAP